MNRGGSAPMKVLILFTILVAGASLSPAHAAGRSDPNWPCPQPKVPQMSVAAIWDGPPIADVSDAWEDNPALKELVVKLAARRTTLDEAKEAVAAFVSGDPTEKQDKAKRLFAGLFDTLNQQRADVIRGIERVDRKQKELADKIRSDVAALRELQDKVEPDQSKINALASEVEWSTRIFDERRKTIRYVCEVPTVIEQRTFTLARAIRQALE
jgi:Spy/CpxP family protein refolding chaperone